MGRLNFCGARRGYYRFVNIAAATFLLACVLSSPTQAQESRRGTRGPSDDERVPRPDSSSKKGTRAAGVRPSRVPKSARRPPKSREVAPGGVKAQSNPQGAPEPGPARAAHPEPPATEAAPRPAPAKASGPKISGAVWFAYEFLDHTPNGSSDRGTPESEAAGFRIGRAYLNVRGESPAGLQGWKYRLTTDIAPASKYGEGCGKDSFCTESNSQVLFLKFAYLDIPLPFGVTLRLGQQNLPSVDGGETGSDPSELWGHRFLDNDGKVPWDELKLSSSADRGIGLFYAMRYLGLHLLLSNGEGYHRNNGERAPGKNDTHLELAQGTADSYGYDFSGRLSLRAPGLGRVHQFHFMVPFRMNAVAGMDASEVEYEQADISNPNQVKWSRLKGDRRAWRDSAYGGEAVWVSRFDTGFGFTLGGGAVVFIDRRGTSHKESEVVRPFDLTDDSCATGRYCRLEDARGVARYVYAHVRFARFGAFGRIIIGTGRPDSLSSTLSSSESGEYWVSALRRDLENGRLGDMTIEDARTIDSGRANFRKSVFGVTYQHSDSFRVALGASRLTGSDAEGGPIRENPMQRVAGPAGSDLSAQVDAYLKKNVPEARVTSNNLVGRRSVQKQVFIRSELKF